MRDRPSGLTETNGIEYSVRFSMTETNFDTNGQHGFNVKRVFLRLYKSLRFGFLTVPFCVRSNPRDKLSFAKHTRVPNRRTFRVRCARYGYFPVSGKHVRIRVLNVNRDGKYYHRLVASLYGNNAASLRVNVFSARTKNIIRTTTRGVNTCYCARNRCSPCIAEKAKRKKTPAFEFDIDYCFLLSFDFESGFMFCTKRLPIP